MKRAVINLKNADNVVSNVALNVSENQSVYPAPFVDILY